MLGVAFLVPVFLLCYTGRKIRQWVWPKIVNSHTGPSLNKRRQQPTRDPESNKVTLTANLAADKPTEETMSEGELENSRVLHLLIEVNRCFPSMHTRWYSPSTSIRTRWVVIGRGNEGLIKG